MASNCTSSCVNLFYGSCIFILRKACLLTAKYGAGAVPWGILSSPFQPSLASFSCFCVSGNLSKFLLRGLRCPSLPFLVNVWNILSEKTGFNQFCLCLKQSSTGVQTMRVPGKLGVICLECVYRYLYVYIHAK